MASSSANIGNILGSAVQRPDGLTVHSREVAEECHRAFVKRVKEIEASPPSDEDAAAKIVLWDNLLKTPQKTATHEYVQGFGIAVLQLGKGPYTGVALSQDYNQIYNMSRNGRTYFYRLIAQDKNMIEYASANFDNLYTKHGVNDTYGKLPVSLFERVEELIQS